MTNPFFSSSLISPLPSSAAMRKTLQDRTRLQRMLDFELALARAQAAVGIVPALALDHIASAARAERFDIAALAQAGSIRGHIASALVEALTAEVAKSDQAAARYVHWGATDQDLIDTALVLDLRAAVDALMLDLNRAIDAFAALAGRHRRTAAVGRAFLQHALPLPFGLKLAGYAAALARSRERLRRLRREALVLQFGGTVGILAALNDKGLDVAERVAALLDLSLPEAPWHTHRDRLAEVAAAFTILAGTCGKIGRDISLLMQTEVGEAFEPAASDAGASSAEKRGPTKVAAALAAANIAPGLLSAILAAQAQEHERGLGNWQAEWTTFPALALIASAGLDAVAGIGQGLEVDNARMRANVMATRGLVMAEAVSSALAAKIGRAEAQIIVEQASRKAVAAKRDLQDVLLEDEQVKLRLRIGDLAVLFEPLGYQGAAQTFIDRAVGALQARPAKR
ncbi:MAG: 3-carboxy-cis,cis-muconate cycloisomerase [Alphaproteobacteria bacterium]|nr:MAG: 3-carboxy-cis,cis-muconate cycloisomerase [Alphaproteobacteria bacterium]